jgi:membrane-associated phospholipid phosphatase
MHERLRTPRLTHELRRRLLIGLLAALTGVVLIAFSYFVLDEPIAIFVHESLLRVRWIFVALSGIPTPLLPAASLALVIIAFRTALGLPLTRIGNVILRCSLSLMVAWSIKDELKYFVGRPSPETWLSDNSSYINNTFYGFKPFHGLGYESFPSGHTTMLFAVGVVLWIYWPQFRWLYLLLTSLTIIGLLGADFHWLSDIIAGAYLGTATATASFLIASNPRHDRP